MRYLVTGATGHVGSFVVRELLRANHEVAVLVRPHSNLWRIRDVVPKLRLIFGSLQDIEAATEQIVGFAPSTVLHLAWHGVHSTLRESSDQIWHNLVGSLRLLEISHAAGCGTWVGLGSQAEYGRHDEPLSEDLPTRPESLYGTSKLCTGLIAHRLCKSYGMRFAWLRLLASYGPYDDPDHFIPYVINKLLRGEQPLLTSGTQECDYLFVEDASKAICAVAFNETASGFFTLGSGRSFRVRHIAEQVRSEIGTHLPLEFGALASSPTAPRCLQADITALRVATGWSPEVDLNAGLRKTIDWYRNSPDACPAT